MKISELSKKSGVSPRMLRYFEQRDLIQPERTEAEYRTYDNEDLKRVLEIREFQRLGCTLREVERLLNRSSSLREETAEILREVFHRERDAFLERQKSLRDLRERFTGQKNPYFENRIAYVVPGLEAMLSQLAQAGWICSECTYWRFGEWQDSHVQSNVGRLRVGQMISKSSFYLIGSQEPRVEVLLCGFTAEFINAANAQHYDVEPPSCEIEKEDLGEFFAPSDVVISISLRHKADPEFLLLLPYRSLIALAGVERQA